VGYTACRSSRKEAGIWNCSQVFSQSKVAEYKLTRKKMTYIRSKGREVRGFAAAMVVRAFKLKSNPTLTLFSFSGMPVFPHSRLWFATSQVVVISGPHIQILDLYVFAIIQSVLAVFMQTELVTSDIQRLYCEIMTRRRCSSLALYAVRRSINLRSISRLWEMTKS